MLLFSVPRSRAFNRPTTCAWPATLAAEPAPRTAAVVEVQEVTVARPAVKAVAPEAPEVGRQVRAARSVAEVQAVGTRALAVREQRAAGVVPAAEESQECAPQFPRLMDPPAPVRTATTRTVAEWVAR
jgi:hypothetical protein